MPYLSGIKPLNQAGSPITTKEGYTRVVYPIKESTMKNILKITQTALLNFLTLKAKVAETTDEFDGARVDLIVQYQQGIPVEEGKLELTVTPQDRPSVKYAEVVAIFKKYLDAMNTADSVRATNKLDELIKEHTTRVHQDNVAVKAIVAGTPVATK